MIEIITLIIFKIKENGRLLNGDRSEEETVTIPPPTFSPEHKQLVVETWHYVENHVTEVRKSAHMNNV